MTDHQNAYLIEQLARAICLCRPGLNPDAPAFEGDGTVFGPNWQTFIKEANAVLECIENTCGPIDSNGFGKNYADWLMAAAV